MRHWFPAFCVAALALIARPVLALDRYEGFAYSATGDTLLYRESQWRDGATRNVLYRCPNGKAFARKRVMSANDTTAPDFVTDDARTGYREGVRSEAGKHTVFYRENASAEERSAIIEKPADAIIDGGFDAYIVKHWGDMPVGQRRDVQFLIPSRLSYADFAITRQTDEPVSGVPARRFRLKLGAWYGFALPQIDVAYAIDGKRLLQYRGIGNMRNDAGKNVSVRVEFPPAMQGAGAENSIADPNAVALDGRCAL